MKKGSRTVAPRRLVCWTAMLLTALGASLARLLGVPAAASWLRRQPARRRRRPSPTRSASVCGAAADEDTDPALPAARNVLRCGSRPAQAQAREASEQSRRCWEAHWRPSWGTAAQANMTATAINLGSESVDSIAVESLGEDFEFDAVVPLLVTSTNTAARLKSIRKYIRPRVRNIYLLVESDVSCRYLTSLGPHVYCLPVHALSGRSGVEMVAAYPHLATSGRHGGWFVQQFAKLFVSLIDVGLSDHFVVIDSDNIFLQELEVLQRVRAASIRAPTAQFFPLEWAEGNIRARLQTKTYSSSDPVLRAVFFAGNNSKMWFRDYGPTTHDLLGKWPCALANGRTAVAHWMVFSRHRVRAMLASIFERVARDHATSFYDVVLDWASRKRACETRDQCKQLASTFSEYELYSTYLMVHHPEEVRYDATSIHKYMRNPPSSSKGCTIDVAALKARYTTLQYATIEDEKTRTRSGCADDYGIDDGLLAATVAAEREIVLRKPPGAGTGKFEYEALRAARSRTKRLVVSVWHVFHEAPWGGGNQFLAALINALRRQDDLIKKVQVNKITKETTAILINAHTFNTADFARAYLKFVKKTPQGDRKPFIVAHRIDGPNIINRANTSSYQSQDRIVRLMNGLYADISIHQSLFSWHAWDTTYPGSLGGGDSRYRPRVIIRNAADPAIFKQRPPCAAPRTPMRLIATSHANGFVKGADTLAALSRAIDCEEFNITFIGSRSREFRLAPHRPCVTVVPPQSSAEIAAALAEHDIFIAASRREPASNSLVEALAVGLPVAYRDEGGHPEAVGLGGVPFKTDDELMSALRTIKERYAYFAAVVGAPLHHNIDDIARQYVAVLRGGLPGDIPSRGA